MKNLNVTGASATPLFQSALIELGCSPYLLDNVLHVEGTPEAEAAAETLAASFDFAAVPVPQVVTRMQAVMALHLAGLLDTVDAMMAQAPPADRIAWTHALEFRRTSPLLLSLAGALNLDAAALDALFITAAGIEA